MSRDVRGLLANLGLAAGALAVSLLGTEAALRLTGLASEHETAARRMVDARWTTLLDCYPSNPRVYFDIDLRRPENDARYRRLAPRRFEAIALRNPWAVEFLYNALRFRDTEVSAKPPGVRRVVILGDSFAGSRPPARGSCARAIRGAQLRPAGPGLS
jgi:hypothetical protein